MSLLEDDDVFGSGEVPVKTETMHTRDEKTTGS